MKKKSFVTLIIVLLMTSTYVKSQEASGVIESILANQSTKNFTTEAVSDEHLEQILKTGIKAPSGKNEQPWVFTAVRDQSLGRRIYRGVKEGNVVIVVAGLEEEGATPDFDCGLATQSMYIAAQSLGLGAHILTGGVSNINTNLSGDLGFPEGYKAVSFIIVGHKDLSVDGVTAASTRKAYEEVVVYK